MSVTETRQGHTQLSAALRRARREEVELNRQERRTAFYEEPNLIDLVLVVDKRLLAVDDIRYGLLAVRRESNRRVRILDDDGTMILIGCVRDLGPRNGEAWAAYVALCDELTVARLFLESDHETRRGYLHRHPPVFRSGAVA